MHDPWPEVFRQSIDISYRPDLSDLARRGCAIADGLTAWGNCHAATSLDTTIPDNFGEVMMKLQAEARTNSATQESFVDAHEKWAAEWEAAKA